jgi:hypothetical protein
MPIPQDPKKGYGQMMCYTQIKPGQAMMCMIIMTPCQQSHNKQKQQQ